MDTLTHALSGSLVVLALGLGRQLPLHARVLAGATVAASPDLDFVTRFVSSETYLELHRGPTHSFVLLPLWALMLAWIMARIPLWRGQRFTVLLGIAVAGLTTHILGDVLTTYGTQIWYPLDTYKASIDTTFIIDLWFTGIIVLGLLLNWKPGWKLAAPVAGCCLLAYVGLQYGMQQKALSLAEQSAAEQGIETIALHAHPQPLSPFHWRITLEADEHYHLAYINVLDSQREPASDMASFFEKLYASYVPVSAARWEQWPKVFPGVVSEDEWWLWSQPGLDGFRNFAEFPSVLPDPGTSEGNCAFFVDLRFELPGRASPFNYYLCALRS